MKRPSSPVFEFVKKQRTFGPPESDGGEDGPKTGGDRNLNFWRCKNHALCGRLVLKLRSEEKYNHRHRCSGCQFGFHTRRCDRAQKYITEWRQKEQ